MQNKATNKTDRFALTWKGLLSLLAGLVVMILGYILMIGGGSDDPQVFSYEMFDFQRLVLSPLVILAGVVIEVLAIMGKFDKLGKGGKQ